VEQSMAYRTAKIASSIVAGVLAGAPLVMPRDVANAAECLTEPGKDGTRGQHWYYRIENGTKRHCWYLRGDDGKAVRTAPADDSVASDAATQTNENPPHSVQDAHAEYSLPQTGGNIPVAPAPGAAPLAVSPVPAQPPADAQGSAVAARWPSAESTIAPAAPTSTAPAPALPTPVVAAPAAAAQAGPAMAAAAPTTTAQPTSSIVADATDSASTTDAATDAPAATSTPAPAATPAVPAKPSVSLQMLFAVIGGALGLAGLTASIVYRLGRRKERRLATSERRAVLWEGVEAGPRPPWVPPEIEDEPVPAPIPAAKRKAAPSRPVQQQRYEKIEEILAQLVRHGQQSDA
jgi:hypothetical protein